MYAAGQLENVTEFTLEFVLQEKEAMKLVRDAIAAGIFNDMGSGSNVDLAVIKANDNVEYHRGYDDQINKKGERKQRYEYKPGTTAVLSQVVRPIVVEETVVRSVPMETE